MIYQWIVSRNLASFTEAGSKLAGRVKSIRAPQPMSIDVPLFHPPGLPPGCKDDKVNCRLKLHEVWGQLAN